MTKSSAISSDALYQERARMLEHRTFLMGWRVAAMRPPGVPHSIFQLLGHTTYWQNWALQWLDGKDPAVPRHAAGSWPSNPGPASPDEWYTGKGQRPAKPSMPT